MDVEQFPLTGEEEPVSLANNPAWKMAMKVIPLQLLHATSSLVFGLTTEGTENVGVWLKTSYDH